MLHRAQTPVNLPGDLQPPGEVAAEGFAHVYFEEAQIANARLRPEAPLPDGEQRRLGREGPGEQGKIASQVLACVERHLRVQSQMPPVYGILDADCIRGEISAAGAGDYWPTASSHPTAPS